MNDHDLLIAFKNGDYEAFEQVYILFNKRVFFFASGFVGKTEVAENIVVESFVTLTRALDNGFDSLGEIKMFLFTVALNQCANYLKNPKLNAASKELIYLMENSEDFIQSKIIRAEFMNLTLMQHNFQ